jgi:hypothetical protein
MVEAEAEIGFAQLGLGSVLKQNQLKVPTNQREYAWETREVRTLLQDFAREVSGADRTYFLGTIVTIPRPDGYLEVVDGQQRLATTAILLAAIRDFLKQSEPELSGSIATEFLTYFNRHTRSRIPRLRLNVDDDDFFRRLVEGEQPPPEPMKLSHSLLAEAFREASKQVKNIVADLDSKDHGNELNRWVDFIETRAAVILSRVPNAANAYRMFETLNDRGKRVSQSDLVKNYLFGTAGDRLPEVQQKWAYMRGALESMEDEDTTINFLRHSLTIMRGFVREADVYEAVQSHVRGQQPAVTFTGQLEQFAYAFVAIHNPDHERWNRHSPSTRLALEVINLFAINPMRPLVLAVAQRFAEQELERAFAFCVSLAMRLMIASSTRTGTVEEGLALAGHKVFTGEVATTDELKWQLDNITPTNGRFQIAFETATVSNRKLSRYYLRSLELTAKGDAQPWHIPNDDQTVINLEHVLPEKPEQAWPEFTEDEVKLYRNRIGNLTLLRAADNSKLQSNDFQAKRVVYADCPYEITRQIAESDEWTPQTIFERQRILARLALQTWKL